MAFIAHNRKCNLMGRHGHVMKRGQWVKKPLLSPQELKAIAGWTGLENCYIPQPATFAGNSALLKVISETTEQNEGTISIWIKNTGAPGSQYRIYDIGDPLTQTAETTRLQIDATGLVDSRLSHFDDPGWSNVAVVNNIPLVVNEWHHYFLTYKNNTVGDGDDKMQVFLNGVQVGIDETFNPADNTITFLANDNIVIGARHDIDGGAQNGLEGELLDLWTTNKYMEPVENIPFFRSGITSSDFVNGTPKYIAKTMNGFTASNLLGGQGYTIDDWNNGVNRGNLADFTLVGDSLT